MRKRPSLIVIVSVLMLLVLVSRGYAQAPPGIPMIITGVVTLNGSSSPDGYNITAWDNGAVVGSTLTSGGNYSVQVCGQSGQSCNPGDTISFQLDQLTTTQTTSFSRGSAVNLNLDFTGTPNQQPLAVTTTQPTMTEAQTSNQTATAVTAVTGVNTPEYQNQLFVLLVAVLVTIGIMTILRRNKRA